MSLLDCKVPRAGRVLFAAAVSLLGCAALIFGAFQIHAAFGWIVVGWLAIQSGGALVRDS